MKYLKQLAILLACCAAGEVLSSLLQNRLPGSVLGLTLLLILLWTGALREQQIAQSADFLLQNMAFLFIPACLGVIDIFPRIANEIWRILAVCTLTTFCTAAATALTVHLTRRLQRALHKGGADT